MSIAIILPRIMAFDRYSYIAEWERKFRPFPVKSRSTSAWNDNYWPHLDLFKTMRYTTEEIERSEQEWAWEQYDKATYSAFFPLHGWAGERG